MEGAIGIGIIGCGSVAEWKYAKNLSSMPGVALRAFFGGRAAEFRDRFGAPGALACENLEALLARQDVDAVCVCTPNSSHAALSIAALRAGKHVLCEKPMATTYEDALAMVRAAEETGRILTVGHQARFSHAAQVLYREVRAGHLGRPRFARASMVRRMGIPTWGMFFDPTVQGGGCLMDLGTHAIDLALWLLDDFSPAACLGSTFRDTCGTPTAANRWGVWDAEALQVETAAFGQVTLRGGAVLSIDTAWALHIPEDREETLTLCGTGAGAELFPGGYAVSGAEADRLFTRRYTLPEEEQTANRAQLADFIQAVRDGGTPLVTPEQSLAVVQVLCGLYRSARESGPVVF